MDKRCEIWFRYVAEHYGLLNQSVQCIEEMSELTQALTKYARMNGIGCKVFKDHREIEENLYEEVADVYIMIMQMIHLLGKEEVQKHIDQKINRQIQRIDDERRKEKDKKRDLHLFRITEVR